MFELEIYYNNNNKNVIVKNNNFNRNDRFKSIWSALFINY